MNATTTTTARPAATPANVKAVLNTGADIGKLVSEMIHDRKSETTHQAQLTVYMFDGAVAFSKEKLVALLNGDKSKRDEFMDSFLVQSDEFKRAQQSVATASERAKSAKSAALAIKIKFDAKADGDIVTKMRARFTRGMQACLGLRAMNATKVELVKGKPHVTVTWQVKNAETGKLDTFTEFFSGNELIKGGNAALGKPDTRADNKGKADNKNTAPVSPATMAHESIVNAIKTLDMFATMPDPMAPELAKDVDILLLKVARVLTKHGEKINAKALADRIERLANSKPATNGVTVAKTATPAK